MKKLILILFLFVGISATGIAQESGHQLSTHILDITLGKPAAEVKISLYEQSGDDMWKLVDEKFTDGQGRIRDFLQREEGKSREGVYKLRFHVAPYFGRTGQAGFYPYVDVVFQVRGDGHYHVPITLTPYGYSTYRGS